MGGRACIRGVRIPVSVVVGQLAHSASVEDVLAEFPELEDDVQQVLQWAAWLTTEEVLLSGEKRRDLAVELQDSVGTPKIESARTDEARKRAAELDSGRVITLSNEEAQRIIAADD